MAEISTAIEITNFIGSGSIANSATTPIGIPITAPPTSHRTGRHITSSRHSRIRSAEASTSRQKMIGTASSGSISKARPLTQISDAPKPVNPRIAAPVTITTRARANASPESSTSADGLEGGDHSHVGNVVCAAAPAEVVQHAVETLQ